MPMQRYEERERERERERGDGESLGSPKVESLETQLTSSREHAEQYKSMSLVNEETLAQLNKTTEEFKADVEQRLTRGAEREEELRRELEELREEKMTTEMKLTEELSETQEVVSDHTCLPTT